MNIEPGDRVSILSHNRNIMGTVESAHNYGTDSVPDWYIELVDDSGNPHYWKQSQDGGDVWKQALPRHSYFRNHTTMNSEFEAVQDAVLETILILSEIPGVRDAFTLAAINQWGDMETKHYRNRQGIGDLLSDIPIDFAFQYVTDPTIEKKGDGQ